MAQKKVSGFKRFLNVLFNIFWVILGGLVGSILCILMGIFTCILIVPIFFGIPKCYFKMIPLMFAPAGKMVVLHFGLAPVRNVFHLIFGGLEATGFAYLWGFILCCTIVFIPIGLQQFKLAKYCFAPFKAEIVKL